MQPLVADVDTVVGAHGETLPDRVDGGLRPHRHKRHVGVRALLQPQGLFESAFVDLVQDGVRCFAEGEVLFRQGAFGAGVGDLLDEDGDIHGSNSQWV
jgi:hypothetical protein